MTRSRRVGIVTDSNSQLPPELADRYGVVVVPLSVTVDGIAYDEGTELSADAFYARYIDGATPVVSTAAPSPGAFLEAYEHLAATGADEVLSIHIGSAVSGTFNAARVAAGASPVPVRLVDTGTASFGISCCVWEAAAALDAGADLETAARVAETTAPSVGNVFVVGALDIVRAGGRLAAGTAMSDGVAVLSLIDGAITPVDRVSDVDEAAAAMVAYVVGAAERDGIEPGGLRVAVGIADAHAAPLSDALEAGLAREAVVGDMVHYRVGPSVGVHSGPGTAGCFFWPAGR